jgi:hypothetical protein
VDDRVPATAEDIEAVCAWMNGGESTPGPYTQVVDAALCRVLDSAELYLANSGGAEHG